MITLLFRIVPKQLCTFQAIIRKQLMRYYEERMKKVADRDCNWLPQETDVFQNTPKVKATIDVFCSPRQSLELQFSLSLWQWQFNGSKLCQPLVDPISMKYVLRYSGPKS